LDVLDLIRRKFWVILFFVLLCSAFSVLYYFKSPKTFESSAKIFVDEKNAPVMNVGEQSSFMNEITIEQYLQTLKSTLILRPAIEDGNFQQMDLFSEADDILFELREGSSLSAKPADAQSSSGVIKLSFQGKSQAECKEVLEAIIVSFQQHIQSTTKLVGGENADLVQRAQDEWLDRLGVVEKEIELLMVRPELLNIDGRIINPYQTQLSLMYQELHDLRSKRNKMIAKIENVKQDQAAGRDSKDLISEIMSEDSDVSDNAYARTQDQLVQLKVEEQALLNQYGGDHPALGAVRRKIETVEQMRLQELTSIRSGSRNLQGGSSRESLVTEFFKQMERKVAMLSSEEIQVDKQIKEIQLKSTSVSALVEKLSALQRERERLEAGYSAVIEKMSEVNALKEHLWRNLSVLDPPSIAEVVAPKLSTCLLAGLFLGGLSGLGFAGFKDLAEKTFRSSDSVGELLNTRVIGHVSQFQKNRNKRNAKFPNVQSEVVTIHAPAAQASEAYRAIRTTVFFKARETGAKVIQLTSPMPGDGKSVTTANLAASIAQSGSRVLIIDADMRKPTQHKLYGIDNTKGLSSVIAGEAGLHDVIQTIIPEYLSIVSAGPIPANPAELLTSARFAAILEEYRDSFDYVLVDTPPMLAVTDPSIVCSHVDAVYMVMRIRNGVRTNAMQAKEIIDSMGIELGGVVINGLRRRDGKKYAYSGQYGYGTNSYGQTARASQQLARASAKR
jgi:capsular exopolysaccharide synthesis family protein